MFVGDAELSPNVVAVPLHGKQRNAEALRFLAGKVVLDQIAVMLISLGGELEAAAGDFMAEGTGQVFQRALQRLSYKHFPQVFRRAQFVQQGNEELVDIGPDIVLDFFFFAQYAQAPRSWRHFCVPARRFYSSAQARPGEAASHHAPPLQGVQDAGGIK